MKSIVIKNKENKCQIIKKKNLSNRDPLTQLTRRTRENSYDSKSHRYHQIVVSPLVFPKGQKGKPRGTATGEPVDLCKTTQGKKMTQLISKLKINTTLK